MAQTRIEHSRRIGRARDIASLEELSQKTVGNPEEARQSPGAIGSGFPDFEAQGSRYVTREARGYMRAAHECVPHLFNFMMPEPEAAAIIGFLAAYASDADVSLSPKRNTQVNPTPELLSDAFRPPDRVREVCQAYSR